MFATEQSGQHKKVGFFSHSDRMGGGQQPTFDTLASGRVISFIPNECDRRVNDNDGTVYNPIAPRDFRFGRRGGVARTWQREMKNASARVGSFIEYAGLNGSVCGPSMAAHCHTYVLARNPSVAAVSLFGQAHYPLGCTGPQTSPPQISHLSTDFSSLV